MGKGRNRWYINNNKLLEAFRNDTYGKEWRKKLQNGRLSNEEWRQIPEKLRPVFRCAQACINKDGIRMKPEMYGNTFTKKIDLEELDKFLARTKKNTAPGLSGIRIDHIASLPDHMRTSIAEILSFKTKF